MTGKSKKKKTPKPTLNSKKSKSSPSVTKSSIAPHYDTKNQPVSSNTNVEVPEDMIGDSTQVNSRPST